ncbi:hypothetical protein CcrSwift_gp222 [Caulobacter phage CcrSwift]|uniref:DUF3301 domain-containing protein n=6 Tax=Viruses TaxID=10239 RepID=K4K415_9CAUD|nr:hypothetical protein D865_gp203 [Caulobacter phage phiCbK]YP_006989955.1 hypothetical protein D870_gp199 [Caulobacter phage CcrSwift]ARB13750.1 hypothetical protein Ccr10_gp220c [Caulobacter phage Ccr10]ARB14095.1 hypothetical protein Ccr2_gp219c [Caulobacter phage Ccr2]ARB14784.1 hypothetical protein Ccr29_gp228 [Caulobacter phage Ccr29]ARB15128.1 hypothetical protein Ccr32_gp210 [Caulobacter phage Ccr32]ARB15462.1 hypothetical protein Ccr34_gp220 [Caulobacter phage Ccr34]
MEDYVKGAVYGSLTLVFFAIGVWAYTWEGRHARHLVERDTGVEVVSFHRAWWSCAGTKSRQGFRFTTADGRRGKICVGGLPYRITYGRD